jgi:hypothetical protein
MGKAKSCGEYILTPVFAGDASQLVTFDSEKNEITFKTQVSGNFEGP